MSREVKGKDLIFISRIERDGKGVEAVVDQERVRHLEETTLNLNCLSISEGTWIASGFNSYVVKLKQA